QPRCQWHAEFETNGSIADNAGITYNAAERSFKRAGENDGVPLDKRIASRWGLGDLPRSAHAEIGPFDACARVFSVPRAVTGRASLSGPAGGDSRSSVSLALIRAAMQSAQNC